VDLGGPWEFAYDDADIGRQQRWPERDDVFPLRIEVPYPPESPLSGIGDPTFHPVLWYRRTFDAQAAAGERMLLHFGAVDYRAEVWVNGRFVTAHEGGHVSFTADITEALRPGAEQVLVVRAEDLPTDAQQPRGKQDLQPEPHNVWYQRTSGIWQPVWLEPVPASRVGGARWVTDVDRGVLGAHVDLVGAAVGCQLQITVSLRGGLLAEDSYTVTAAAARDGLTRDLMLPRPEMRLLDWESWLWSPEYPNLMDVTVTLIDGSGHTLDRVDSYVGFRSVGTSANRFTLNGRPYYLRLVLAQGYWPQSHLAAPSEDALKREVELAKELGFNGVRLHQKVEDPRFLYWCDRLGLAVWAELPAALDWSAKAARRSIREWVEVLERDISAPSIVTWVPVNESWGVPALQTDPAQQAFVQAMYSLAKALDATRPVVGNDGWEHVVTDMVTVHDYASEGHTLRDRYGSQEAVERSLQEVQPYYRPLLLPGLVLDRQPILLTEFGGVSYQTGQGFWNAYGTAADDEDFLLRYRDLLDAVLASPVLAGFCYTQLSDTEQEQNGLLTADRRPKADLNALRAITRSFAAAVPGDAIYGHQTGEHPTPIQETAPDAAIPRQRPRPAQDSHAALAPTPGP
jgi:beta-galactosidase/beta-glucuronidase